MEPHIQTRKGRVAELEHNEGRPGTVLQCEAALSRELEDVDVGFAGDARVLLGDVQAAGGLGGKLDQQGDGIDFKEEGRLVLLHVMLERQLVAPKHDRPRSPRPGYRAGGRA